MSGQYFMPLWTDAYLGDTRHLSTLQHGAYLLILMAMWRNGGTLPNDEKRLARIAGLSMDKWRKARTEVMELLDIEGDVITQKRLGLELKKTTGLAQKRALAGSAGGRAKSLKTKESPVANATQVPEQKGSLQIQLPDPVPTPSQKPSVSVEGSAGEDPDAIFREAAVASRSVKPPTTPKTYAFEAGIIKLNQRDYDRFKTIYRGFNLDAELLGLARWVEQEAGKKGGDWFNPMIGALNKRLREAERQARDAKIRAEADAKHASARLISRPAI